MTTSGLQWLRKSGLDTISMLSCVDSGSAGRTSIGGASKRSIDRLLSSSRVSKGAGSSGGKLKRRNDKIALSAREAEWKRAADGLFAGVRTSVTFGAPAVLPVPPPSPTGVVMRESDFLDDIMASLDGLQEASNLAFYWQLAIPSLPSDSSLYFPSPPQLSPCTTTGTAPLLSASQFCTPTRPGKASQRDSMFSHGTTLDCLVTPPHDWAQLSPLSPPTRGQMSRQAKQPKRG